ncbi:hypothetical protein [Polymorphum gilvum]|nr:hypothetical protein [Polymorphum gilvum]
MSTPIAKSAPAAEKPNLDQLYKPVGIQAITAAALCSKSATGSKSGK